MQGWLMPTALAMIAGGGLVLQQALNTNLRSTLHSAVWAGFFSYLVGLVCMILLCLVVRDSVPDVNAIGRVHWANWLGGACGAVYIGLAIILLPVLGSTVFVALLVTGQMITALAFDHFGLFGLAERPMDPTKLLGVALLVGGVILIRR